MLSWKERFRALATILAHPRATMRRVLDHRPDRMIVPLILVAVLSSFLKDLTTSGVQLAMKAHSLWLVAAIVVGAFILFSILSIVFVYAMSWIAMLIGRFFEGTGTAADVRSALAWGLAPIAWALVIRLPLYVFLPPPNEAAMGVQVLQNRVKFDPSAITGASCGIVALYALIDLAVLIAYLVIASQTLGEAHRFSGWRGFATLMLSFVTPLIVMVAAFLAVAM